MENRKLWFKAKTFGWGWTPATWQGWLSMAIYIALLVVALQDMGVHSFRAVSAVVLLTGFMMLLCYGTGERPRWRWGNKG